MNIIVISLIATIIFGIIDSIFFLVAEDNIQNKLLKLKFFDETTAELFTGGLSSSTAIFIASYIGILLHKHFEILEHPIIDAIGIMTGTILVILFYKLWKYYIEKK